VAGGGALSSAGSIRQSAKIIAEKVSALRAKQGSTPTPTIRRPARVGPTSRAEWISTLLRLTALTTRSGPTISIAKLCLVGLSTALTVPRRKTRTKTIQGATVPPRESASSASAGSAIRAWVIINRLRFGKRSASTPPHAPKSRIGRNWRAVVVPTARPLPVSERISQTSATICIQFPESETICPAK